ncbi:hypothetical protein SAMN04487895_12420 [Paenibacillus sophorae]|uniref:Uncharacterized protein n=1 Tax=Paenibacillus sophorae TaxID=1333845 RepID=A0A1H8VI66_9BACL|nr:hypothetical protein [Paenibacillus sophorae]QWU15415.1 hypothetical protein KP014_26665 [Paenibacillus sophorae]SEP14578.1 hypothetical protein SAMN04487895_12420 [Paenibacillus sophorae]
MFNKQKRPFWQLSSVFAVIIVLVLAHSWSNRTENAAQMDASMADMMSNEILGNTTVPDLFTLGAMDSVEVSSGNGEHSGHHDQTGTLYAIHLITTALLLFTLPVILAGALFLAIVWPKSSKRRKTN